jgi:hypothetical protein
MCLQSSMWLYGMGEDNFKFKDVRREIKLRCSIVRSTECIMLLQNQLILVTFITMIADVALELKFKMLTTFQSK